MNTNSKYYPAWNEELKKIFQDLKGQKTMVLGHVRPDGDCIGSQVALCRCLREAGVPAVAVNADTVPRVLQPFIQDTPFHLAEEFDVDGYVTVMVDCADHIRLGHALKGRLPEIVLNIDHHISNKQYAEHNFIDAEASATAEILTGLFLDMDFPLDPVTAQALYIGIATDTGQFRFNSTDRKVFDICSHLVEKGANPAAAAIELYERESPAKLQLLQRFIATFQYICDGRACIGILTDKDFAETGALKEDTEGLVDYARAIEGVEIGVLLEGRGGSVKGSFRAKEPVHRVDQLAIEFNGGGHACAAGFNCPDTLDAVEARMKQRLHEHFSQLVLDSSNG